MSIPNTSPYGINASYKSRETDIPKHSECFPSTKRKGKMCNKHCEVCFFFHYLKVWNHFRDDEEKENMKYPRKDEWHYTLSRLELVEDEWHDIDEEHDEWHEEQEHDEQRQDRPGVTKRRRLKETGFKFAHFVCEKCVSSIIILLDIMWTGCDTWKARMTMTQIITAAK